MASNTSAVTVVQPSRHTLYIKLAREIAMDLNKIEDILKAHNVAQAEWAIIAGDAHFIKLLQQAAEAWAAAENANTRVQLKSAHLIELWLDKGYEMLAQGDLTPAKVELLKVFARFAGLGLAGAEVKETGSRFVVNINLGADQQIKIEKDVTPKVIDGEAV